MTKKSNTMTVKQIYDLSIKMGIKADPRGVKKVNELMKRRKEQYEKLSDKEKEYYNKEKLNNPYPDAMTLVGSPSKEIKRVLAGIDIDTPEVLLADKIGNIDLIISHHPEWPYVPEVMEMQTDFLNKYGLSINVAEWFTKERSSIVYPLSRQEYLFKEVDLEIDYLIVLFKNNLLEILSFTKISNIKENILNALRRFYGFVFLNYFSKYISAGVL